MLGTALIDILAGQYEIFATSRSLGIERENTQWELFDLTDLQRLDDWLISIKPDVVIHCAAMVDVDECEKNKDIAKSLHIKTTEVIARKLQKSNGQLVYISTDSVFDGNKKTLYTEDDDVQPLNFYAKTKLLGEAPVLLTDKGLVLRTNIIGWSRTDKESFAEWVLKGLVEQRSLTLFHDVLFSPLHVSDLSIIIKETLGQQMCGLYHASSRDYVSKFDFGVIMADIFGLPSGNLVKKSVDELGLKAKRPKNMVLSNSKLHKEIGHDFPRTKDAVKLMKEQYLKGWVSNIKKRKMANGYEFWRVG
jgi:dTDP-4-dehydrorhamnose reductase